MRLMSKNLVTITGYLSLPKDSKKVPLIVWAHGREVLEVFGGSMLKKRTTNY